MGCNTSYLGNATLNEMMETPLDGVKQVSNEAIFKAKSTIGINIPEELNRDNIKFGLSERETLVVQRTWKKVRTDIPAVGKLVFMRMFEMSPNVKSAFEKFRTLDNASDMFTSDILETHGMVVLATIDDVIQCLDERDIIIDLLIEQGLLHFRFGDLTREIFWAIREPFLLTVAEILDNQYTANIAKYYQITIDFIVDTLCIGFDLSFKQNNIKKNTQLTSHR